MKSVLIYVLFSLLVAKSFAQISNVRAGLWGDPAVWNNNLIPSGTDDILLNFDITVNVNAVCQSLTLNGHNITVNTGYKLSITGNDNTTTLSKFIVFDTTASAPLDTLYTILFYYDTVKRNIGIDLIYYENGGPGDYQFKSTFFYNGTDTLPFKKIVVTPFLANTDNDFVNDTCFYFYINGRLVMDSTIETSTANHLSLVYRYAYTAEEIISQFTMFNPGPVYSRNDTIHLQYVNGNITHQTDTSEGLSENFDYTYDTHPNPFFRTQNKIAIDNRFPFYYMETFIEEIFGKNNAVDINQTSNGYNYHIKNTYEYKANGYPRTVWQYDQNDPGTFGKGRYFYTN